MEDKERWSEVREAMRTEIMSLSWKMSSTVKNSLTGLEFILARYKFAAKMLQNRKAVRVLDLGCNDGLGDLLIAQCCDCSEIVGIDFDKEAIEWAEKNVAGDNIRFLNSDFMGAEVFPLEGDCVVSLDVIEHIDKRDEKRYLDTICGNLKDTGFAIIGTPNITMFPYASPWNKKAHINNYSQERLYELLSGYFENVFMFGMNDEVLHTGFYPMACYIMALACGKRCDKWV